mgnify:CR=1 FL=1
MTVCECPPPLSTVPLPVLMQPLQSQLVVGVGGSVDITCSATSENSSVNVSITTTASNMDNLPTSVPDTATLSLTNVMVDRAGEYTCTATNARGSVTDTTQLYVVGELINEFIDTVNSYNISRFESTLFKN